MTISTMKYYDKSKLNNCINIFSYYCNYNIYLNIRYFQAMKIFPNKTRTHDLSAKHAVCFSIRANFSIVI